MNRRIPAALVIAAAVFSLAACSGGDAPQKDAARLSPIDQYMYASNGTALSDEESEAKGNATLLEIEELIAVCMNEQGFDYIPYPPTPMGFSFNNIDSPDLDDPAWVERYGYGIVNGPDQKDVTVVEDPNVAIVESLSDAERTAYYLALSGGVDAFDADGNMVPDKAGCMGAAQAESMSQDPLSDEFGPLRESVQEFYADLYQSAEVAELDARWAECMDAAGHGPYTTQIEPLAEINWTMSDIVKEGGETAWESSEMEELGAREVTLALADLACREETDYRASFTALRETLEERFVEENLPALEAYKAAAEQEG